MIYHLKKVRFGGVVAGTLMPTSSGEWDQKLEFRLRKCLRDDILSSEDINRDRLLTHNMLVTVSFRSSIMTIKNEFGGSYKTEVQSQMDQGSMSGCCGGNENCLSATVPHALLGIRVELD